MGTAPYFMAVERILSLYGWMVVWMDGILCASVPPTARQGLSAKKGRRRLGRHEGRKKKDP